MTVTNPDVLGASAIVAEARRAPFGRQQVWFELLESASVPTLCAALAQLWGPGEREPNPEHMIPYRESVAAVIHAKLTREQVETMERLDAAGSQLRAVGLWVAIVGAAVGAVQFVSLFA